MGEKKRKLTAGEKRTYGRLLQHTKPYRLRLFLGVLFGALFGFSMGGLLIGAGRFVGVVFGGPAQASAALSQKAILGLAMALPLIALLRGVGDYCSTYFVEWVGTRVVMDIRLRLFAHLQQQSLAFFGRHKTGELISRITNDTSMVESAVSNVLADLCKQPFGLIGVLGAMVYTNWKLAAVGLLLFPVCIVPVAYFGRRVRQFSREGQAYLADMTAVLQENIAGARVVRAFTMEPHEEARFGERCRAVFSRAMRVTRARAAVDPLVVFISILGASAFLIFCLKSRITLPDVITFAGGLVAMYDPVKKLSRIHLSIQRSSAAADRIFDLLDTPPSVTGRPEARVFAEPLREIAFEGVSFSYGDEPVLKDISLAVPAGRRVALVGGSGAGKTTFVSLLPRFYDVTAGAIRVNGTDVRDMTLPSLRHLVGVVTQETFLFNDTVAANIGYGQPGSSRADIERAAGMAHAHDFIRQLPLGYDTTIGDRGMRLSGGQCQRLAIARAILRNPPILILDEATSALDTESERQVQAALDELMEGRTVFAIAHRLSTIIHSDLILVLDKGRIVEQGTHAELLARGGQYKYLYDLQFKEKAG